MIAPTAAVDVIALLDAESGAQLVVTARPMKVTVKTGSKTMEHPLETGAVVVDHRVVLPVEAELSMLLATEEAASVYQQLLALFQRGTVLSLQTRAGTVRNMIIESMPHDESPELWAAFPVSLTLKEVLFVTPQFAKSTIKPKAAANGKTVKRGEQQPKTSSQEPRKSSILGSIFR